MVKIDRLIFGFRRINVSEEKVGLVSSLFVRYGLDADVLPDGTVFVRERDFHKVSLIFDEKVDYKSSETLGLLGALKKINYKATVIITSIVMLCVLLFLTNLVWDIRIIGNEKLTDAKIIYELSKNGFSLGSFWPSCNRSEIETNMLKSLDGIGWININRRGSVAYVELIENKGEEIDAPAPMVKYSNIVASVDCVIEEITVTSGVAVVKAGDVVKKGDLLISGVMTADEGLCRAEGSVKGRMTDRVSVTTDRNYVEKVDEGEKLCSLSFNLFNFSVNILKIYGNLANECDIIEDVKEYSLFGRCKLPFSITREYTKRYSTTECSYTDSEIVEVTSELLSSAVHSRLVAAELCRIKTCGEFTSDGYTMYSDIVFSSEVGQEVEFTVGY